MLIISMGSYGTLDEFKRRTRSGIEDSLFQGEKFLGAIDVYDALFRKRRTKLILTDQRLLEFKRGWIRQSITDYDRDRISNISFNKGIIYRTLGVSGSGFDEEWTVDYEDGQPFAAAIRSRDPVPVFVSPGDSDSSDAAISAGATDETSRSTPTESATSEPSEPEPYLTDPSVEVYGFDKWHYAALGAALVGFFGASVIEGLLAISLIAAGVFLYLDALYMQKASTWQPRTWLYIVGLLFVFLSVPVYLYHRHQVTSRTKPDESADSQPTSHRGKAG